MKVALALPPMERFPLSLQFSATELLWRYPLGFPSSATGGGQAPASTLHLPPSLASDPRIWSREDVATFLSWCEREFDLPHFNMDMFQMNGKALCLLTKGDLGERCPGAGDVLHNVLQLLVSQAQMLARCLPSSPVTPTSRHYPQLLPPSPSTWGLTDFQTPSLVHLVQQGNSVTLSPAPSLDSQSGSPQHADHNAPSYHGGSNGSNQSESDEDSYQEGGALPNNTSPPSPPELAATAPQLPPPTSPTSKEVLNSPGPGNGSFRGMAREFFPADTPEPNTNGRLLWDFLQQLLNDPTQRYTNYIAWKNRETGVFKIVDPAGLAKLWGIQKNHLSMNYDKMSRALRYYYRVNILRKVQGERHCYQFLRNPSELKSIKNMSLLRQQVSPPRALPHMAQHQQPSMVNIKMEPEVEADDLGPTDLSMEHPTDLSPTRPSPLCHPELQHSEDK